MDYRNVVHDGGTPLFRKQSALANIFICDEHTEIEIILRNISIPARIAFS